MWSSNCNCSHNLSLVRSTGSKKVTTQKNKRKERDLNLCQEIKRFNLIQRRHHFNLLYLAVSWRTSLLFILFCHNHARFQCLKILSILGSFILFLALIIVKAAERKRQREREWKNRNETFQSCNLVYHYSLGFWRKINTLFFFICSSLRLEILYRVIKKFVSQIEGWILDTKTRKIVSLKTILIMHGFRAIGTKNEPISSQIM